MRSRDHAYDRHLVGYWFSGGSVVDDPQECEAMSLYDYTAAKRLWRDDSPFYALIMAAMYRADSTNAEKLRAAFPETWAELDARYHAPGGLLEGEAV